VTTLTKDTLFTQNEALREEIEGLRLLHARDEEKITHLDGEIDRLRELIGKLQKQAFGPRSERWETEEQGKLVFNEAEVEAAKPEGSEECAVEGADREVTVAAHKKKIRGHRKPLPEHLPREIVVLELPPADRVDAAGNELKVVGKEISEKLSYEPAKISVIEYHRLRYGYDSGEPVKTAPPVPSIIPKGMVTPSLLAAIVTAKYADGLPLYRQEEIFLRQAIELSRTSMARWIVQAAEKCLSIWNILEGKLLEKPYVAADETHVQVLKEKGRRAQTKSWMWLRTNPLDQERIVLFDYDPHRTKEVAARLFADYKGILQCDGYGSYDVLEKNPDLIRIGCNMHGRRKFKEADEGSAKSKSLAGEGLKYYRALYAVEEEIKDLTPEERYRIRQEKAAPIWSEFKAWAEEKNKRVPRKTSIGDAFHYFLNEYDYLVGYLRDGRLNIDNGEAERKIKYVAIGRKNWLFCDTPEGANASALFYSFVVTAKANGVNPYEALKKIFTELPLATSIDDFERLAGILLGTTGLA
jgi:transposase